LVDGGFSGTFSPQELAAGLKKYALTSAFKDSRFKPMLQTELPALSCDVSLLTQFESAKDCYDWKIGVHGIQIDFADPKKPNDSFSATYLPEVASEQGWSHAQAITELVAKSGYTGAVTAQLRSQIKLTRYQSMKASLSYSEYSSTRKLKN